MYYLRAIYKDGNTRLGTFGNRTFEGRDINRVIQNFKKNFYSRADWDGNNIVGVEVEYCVRKYADGVKKKVIFGSGSERI